MKISLATSLGMCFGVRDAIDLALNAPRPEDLTILGDLVHNPVVLRRLDEAGIRRSASPANPAGTAAVMITAHGASRRVVDQLVERGHQVYDATCPLVRHAHRALDRLVDEGYFPVVIGRADHVEVRGLVGDLEDFAVLLDREDLWRLEGRDRLGIVAQTTQTVDQALDLVDAIGARFPDAEVKFVDTVCRPTKERQQAARRLASKVEVMVVIGGRSSNNTAQLACACAEQGAPTYQVERPEELRPEWFAGVEHVGVTAGTSTPDETIRDVVAALHAIAP